MSDAVQHYWLNHNKILRPPLRAHLRRTRLLGQLKASLDAKLILACAEAGYGKTQLALDYLREWTSPAIWYRLDRSDQDLTQFIAYLTEALRQHFGGFGNDIQYIVSRGERDKDDLPRLLQHEMSLHVCRPLLVVLDGFETVAASAGVCRLVSELLEYSGPNVQFFITSRTVPPLPIARLEVQRETIVLGPGELAFSLEESRRLFADVRGLKASDDQVDLLWNCTDGWPAGLIMMADNLLKSPFGETDNPLNPFQGVPDSVYRYFASEVLETLSPESQEFLLRTSILTKLSHESVNSLLGIANAGELLTELKSTGAFVRDTEGDESRLRYHPLFRSFLRQKLHQRYGVDQIHEMYRRAAQAACRDGDWGTAIDYFATARDWEEVRAVMESVGEELTMRGLLETFRQWLERVPEEQIYSRPVLLMLRGRLLRLAGLYREGLRDLDRALRGFEQEGNLANGVLTQHEIAVCHYWLGEYQRAEVVLSSALRLSGDDPSLRSRILADLARNCIGFDELERGQHWGQMAVNASMVIGRGRTSSQMLVRALRFHGQALLLMGDLQRGLEEITRSVELCRLEDLGDLQCSWSLLFLGQGLSLQGSFGEAIRSLDEAEALAHGNSALLDHIRVWRGNSYRDSNALDRAERDYERCKDGAPKELALLWLREGRISDGLRLAEKAYRSSCEGESPSEKAACQVVYGLALARAADSCSGLEQLSAAAEILRARGRKQQLASVLWSCGQGVAGGGTKGRSSQAAGECRALGMCLGCLSTLVVGSWDYRPAVAPGHRGRVGSCLSTGTGPAAVGTGGVPVPE